MSGSPTEWRAPTGWAVEEILLPVLRQGIADGRIEKLRGLDPPGFVEELRRIFELALELRRAGLPIDPEGLAAGLDLSQAQLMTRLGRVGDWNRLVDEVRLRRTTRGALPLRGSILVLKGDPFLRTGANIFGVASRSIPGAVIGALAEEGLAPENASPNVTATENPAWLIEVGPGWSLALRIEPLPQDTWFDPERYEREFGTRERAIAEEELRRIHKYKPRSTRRIVGEDVFGSLFASIIRAGRTAAGVTVESGCLPHGVFGREELFIGSRLDQAMAIESHGARAFLDLARLSAGDPGTRRRPEGRPWSGYLGIGEATCVFDLEGGLGGVLQSWDMALAASAALGLAEGDPRSAGIFRPADRRMVAEACQAPGEVNYAVAQVGARKAGERGGHWRQVGLLVGSRAGMLPSGWSVPFADMRTPSNQREVIAMAEAHIARMGPDGAVAETMGRLRGAGVQGSQARTRPHVQALNGLIFATDILDLRSRLYI
jgi:hypothetical protein